MEKLSRVRLKKGRLKRVTDGHPWIFSNELREIPPLEPGCLVAVDGPQGELLGVGYFNPRSLIAVRWLQRGGELPGDWLECRLEKAAARRDALYRDEECVRVVFSEADDLPGLVVDRFGDALVVQTQTAGMERHRERTERALRDLFHPRVLVRRDDGTARSLEGLPGRLEADPPQEAGTSEVAYLGLRLQVPLMHGQKTGLFLDQRDNVRAFLGHLKPGSTVLDVFCYLGVWGMAALKSGAASAEFADASESACEAVLEGLKANGLPDTNIHCGEAAKVLRTLRGEGQKFDAVVLDPPAFARSRKHLPEALHAYRRLNALAMPLVAPGGLLVSCSCSQHVTREDFREALRGAAAFVQRKAWLLEIRGQAPDHPVDLRFPEGDYLKAAFLRLE